MLKQLLLCKRLFGEGVVFTERSDAVSSGLAISLFQDSVEMFVWVLIKERGIPIKDGSPFTVNLEAIQKAGVTLSHTAKIIELNKARVGFKHYGNLPDQGEALKFQTYVEEFLRASFSDHCGQNFDNLSMVDLVSDPEVRARLKQSEKSLDAGDFSRAMSEGGIAKAMLFAKLNRFVPRVDHGLKEMDSFLGRIPELRGSQAFHHITNYLEMLREATLASLLKFPLQDFELVQRTLHAAFQFGNGTWQASPISGSRYDEQTCKKALASPINLAIRLESVL